ncbi:hypothetical protein NKDENANG_02346 [Candidatus Entotheonellaceae bacterium PAL068K]
MMRSSLLNSLNGLFMSSAGTSTSADASAGAAFLGADFLATAFLGAAFAVAFAASCGAGRINFCGSFGKA